MVCLNAATRYHWVMIRLQICAKAFRDALVYHMEHQEYANVRQYVFRAGFWERLSKTYVEAFEKLDAEFGAWANEGIESGMQSGVFSSATLADCQDGA